MKKSNLLPWLAAAAALCNILIVIGEINKQNSALSGSLKHIASIRTAQHKPPPLFDDKIQFPEVNIAASASYKNLQLYLLQGKTSNHVAYITLEDALRRKLVRIREKGDVNELQMDNLSAGYVYINSGDIVKGGQQDRTIQYDVIISPNERNVDIASFCVERGRWSQRGVEDDKAFETSEKSLSSKALKLAAKGAKSQAEVWRNVEKYQQKANEAIKMESGDTAVIEVRSNISPSSLELTLDDAHIKQSADAYKTHLLATLKNIPGATGMAVSINGQLYSVDLYNNQQLFADLFDKLLDAAIAEAISETVKGSMKPRMMRVDKILLATGKVYEDFDVNQITRFQSSEPEGFPDVAIFTTIDKTQKSWLHRNWLDNTTD